MTVSVGFAAVSTPLLIENIIAKIKDHQLLEEICREQGVPVEPVEQLLQIEKDKSGLMRRNNLFKDTDMALKNYLKRQEVKALRI